MSARAQGAVAWERKGEGAAVCHLHEAVSRQGFHRRTERRTEPSQGLCSEHGGSSESMAKWLPFSLMEDPGMRGAIPRDTV